MDDKLKKDHNFFDKLDEVYTLLNNGEISLAEKQLLEVYNSIPHPKENARMGNPVFSALIAFYEKVGKIEKALPFAIKETDFLKEKIKSEKTYNPNKFLLTGKIYYQLKELNKAREYFLLAFKTGKKRVFQEENPDFYKIATLTDEDFLKFKLDFSPINKVEKLSDFQANQIDELCELGNKEMDEGNFREAISTFSKALSILPNPKEIWEAYWWLNASIGDAYFQIRKYKDALNLFSITYKSADLPPNPFILLRLGQCYYKVNNFQMAIEFLLRAYMLDGEEIFEGEKEYLTFLKSEVEL